jgi:amino acid transporter
MFVLAALIVIGLTQSFLGDGAHVPFDPKAFDGSLESGGSLGIFLLLKGFSSGAVALTGVEAISNGVPAFRRPESKNAAATLVWMGVLLGSLFLGVSVLAHHLKPYPSHDQTVMAQMGLAVFGNGPAFVLLQFATAAILTLAANTAYNGFPSLSSIIAKDGYLPRQLAHRGDRLVFSNGIIVLAAAAAALLVAFNGITNALIPLYAVGVFTSFTLSQWGMTRHHRRLKKAGWRRNVALNATGAIATLAVLLIVATTKFTSGAWIPLVVIPLIVLLFKAIKSHYDAVARGLKVPPDWVPPRRRHGVVVLAQQVDTGLVEAVAYAQSTAPDRLVAVNVASTPEQAEQIEKQWLEENVDAPLEVVRAPAGDFTTATLRFIDELERRWPDTTVTVVIPELFVTHWWEHLLHNQSVLLLKGRLLFRSNTAVTSIPYGTPTESLLDG